MNFSLIMATYGRKEEVSDFLKSIVSQVFDTSTVEIIIVDQNDHIFLDDIIVNFQDQLNITHIKSNIKGLSYNRNIGLGVAKGKYIAFPDDDCTYYPETLITVNQLFEKETKIDIFLGKIFDKKNKKNIIRNWKDHSYLISAYNFYTSYSSITIFTRKNNITFDENLGVGKYFGSNEDADYILQALMKNSIIKYTPAITVWHPDFSAHTMSHEKTYTYGLGFGALCKKYNNFPILVLSIQVLSFHFFKMLIGIVKVDKYEIKKRKLSILSRIKGYLEYETK